jgi:hypothetical protein
MKYFKKTLTDQFVCYQPDPAEYGREINIPHDPANRHWAEMVAGLEEDPAPELTARRLGITLDELLQQPDRIIYGTSDPTNTIEDKPIDHVKTWADNRRDAYGNIGDQLDMQYHDAVDGTTTWKDHVTAVKAANPKG